MRFSIRRRTARLQIDHHPRTPHHGAYTFSGEQSPNDAARNAKEEDENVILRRRITQLEGDLAAAIEDHVTVLREGDSERGSTDTALERGFPGLQSLQERRFDSTSTLAGEHDTDGVAVALECVIDATLADIRELSGSLEDVERHGTEVETAALLSPNDAASCHLYKLQRCGVCGRSEPIGDAGVPPGTGEASAALDRERNEAAGGLGSVSGQGLRHIGNEAVEMLYYLVLAKTHLFWASSAQGDDRLAAVRELLDLKNRYVAQTGMWLNMDAVTLDDLRRARRRCHTILATKYDQLAAASLAAADASACADAAGRPFGDPDGFDARYAEREGMISVARALAELLQCRQLLELLDAARRAAKRRRGAC